MTYIRPTFLADKRSSVGSIYLVKFISCAGKKQAERDTFKFLTREPLHRGPRY